MIEIKRPFISQQVSPLSNSTYLVTSFLVTAPVQLKVTRTNRFPRSVYPPQRTCPEPHRSSCFRLPDITRRDTIKLRGHAKKAIADMQRKVQQGTHPYLDIQMYAKDIQLIKNAENFTVKENVTVLRYEARCRICDPARSKPFYHRVIRRNVS